MRKEVTALKMSVSLKDINEKIVMAGRLDHRVIGVYCSNLPPAGAVTVSSVINGYPCLAKALYKMSIREDVPSVYTDVTQVDQQYIAGGPWDKLKMCQVGLMWLGYKNANPERLSMIYSSDSPDKNSYAVKQSSAHCIEAIQDIGKPEQIANCLVMQALSEINSNLAGSVRSIICYGNAVQIRTLMALIHFTETRAYTPIMASWGGATCSSLVALAAGITGNSPENTAFIGPTSPEPNHWIPQDILSLSIPMEMAIRMAEGFQDSFAIRRQDWAYPDVIEDL